MAYSFINAFLVVFAIFILSSCKLSLDEENKIKQIVEHYTTYYEFSNESFYEPIFDEFYNDTLHRYYWDLDKNKIKSHLDNFSFFDSQSFLINHEDSYYQYFGVIMDNNGRITDEGFFDENLSFTGIHYWHNEEGILTNKYFSKLDRKFYEVIFQLESSGNVTDSSYKYYPIVHFDIDTFDGPFLTVCFNVQLIIDINKYSYEEFQLFYTFYDTRNYSDTKLIDGQKDRILENLSQKSSDGYYSFCHDLEVKNHLMMAFGVLVEAGISEQDLSFGTFHGPIINKNIDRTEL